MYVISNELYSPAYPRSLKETWQLKLVFDDKGTGVTNHQGTIQHPSILVSIQQQLYFLRVGLIKIERGFFSHIYARRAFVRLTRVPKWERDDKGSFSIVRLFLQILTGPRHHSVGIL